MQTKLVSIMMPAYNASQYIAQAIESVLAQSYSTWELIVVDDGSTDDTAAIVAYFADPRIKLVRQSNQGEAAARNRALQQMQGEYLAFLDADDLYLPNHLAIALDFLAIHSTCAGVYTDGYYCTSNGDYIKTLSSRRRGPFAGDLFAEVVRGSNVFGPPLCVVLQRAPIIQHGIRFDESITIGPDWVFFMDYAAIGSFGYAPQVTCLYRIHQSNITVQVNLQKRALELAKCRIHAMKMPSFTRCPLEVRVSVFYDLLVNLLRDFPERQETVVQWPEFLALPAPQQARIYRLMVSQSLLYAGHNKLYMRTWLRRSRALDARSQSGALLSMLYRINPYLCKWLLRIKARRQIDPMSIAPFADLVQEKFA